MSVSAPARPVVSDAPPPAAVAPRSGGRQTVAMIAVVAAIFAAMQIASMFVPAYVMPPLAQTLGAVVNVTLTDWSSIVITVVRVLGALICAAVVGTALGCVMGMNGRLRPYLQSSLVVDTGVPALSWMLIAVFWFKNPEIRIFFVLFVILLPFYALSVFDGIKALPKEWIEAINVFRPTRGHVLRLLILPHIVPYMLLTTKSIIGYATRMVVFAELIGAAIGIGAKMGLAEATFKMPEVLAWTLILVVINIASQAGVGSIERRLLHWRPEVALR
jgi:NitT/TauT family transport system permease protein